MPVETSTCARGNQYQKGHVESLVPKPKKNKMYKQYNSSGVKVKYDSCMNDATRAKQIMYIKPRPTKKEPATAQPAKNKIASTAPRLFAVKYITKNTKPIINSYMT